MTPAPAPRRPRGYRLLAALPALVMLAGVPLANRTEPYVLGLPFLLFWILLWVVATSAVMTLVYRLDTLRDVRERPDGAGPGPEEADGRSRPEGADRCPDDVARESSPDAGSRP